MSGDNSRINSIKDGKESTIVPNAALNIGEQASLLMDLKNNIIVYENDNDRHVYIRGRDGNIKKLNKVMTEMTEDNFSDTKNAGFPVRSEEFGFKGTMPMSIGRQKLFQDIYNDPLTGE